MNNIVLRWKISDKADRILFPVCRWSRKISTATGLPFARYHCGKDDPPIEVPWFHRLEAGKRLSRPMGYLVEAGRPQIEERLRAHGLLVRKIPQLLSSDVESIRVEDPVLATRSYQGQVEMLDFTILRTKEHRSFPPGSLWIPAAQPHFEIAVQLLEPEAPDSLLRWGYLHSILERKEYIGSAELEVLVHEMLKDPSIRQQWEAVKKDLDAEARYLWWYSRTPYWDRKIGLLPYARVMEMPEEMQPGKRGSG